MFTGIVTHIGIVKEAPGASGGKLVLKTDPDIGSLDIGASVSCSGVCLTVVAAKNELLTFDVSAETLSRTAWSGLKPGDNLNLERSLRVGDELGGHIVTGHVDATSVVQSIKPDGDSHRIVFSLPKGFEAFVAEKGSITIDGVSLTVNEVDQQSFSVNIVPHTWGVTTFGDLKAGDMVNVEIDILARYMKRMVEQGIPQS